MIRASYTVVLFALLVVVPVTAHGQWAVTYSEYDWRVSISGGSYGIVQEVLLPGEVRTTKIFLGHQTFSTPVRAIYVVMMVVFSVLAVFVAVWAGLLRRKTMLNNQSNN